MLKPRAISLQEIDFQSDTICLIFFSLFMERKFPKQGQVQFQNTMRFESGFNNFRNFFFSQ